MTYFDNNNCTLLDDENTRKQMKRCEPVGVNSCAEVELILAPCKRVKMTETEITTEAFMCRWVFMLPLDVIYTIMRCLDVNRLRALCCIIFDMYNIKPISSKQFARKYDDFTITQIEILRRTSEILDDVNLIRSGTWLRPMLAEIGDKLSWLRYGDTYNCVEVTVDKMTQDLCDIQNSIKIMKESHSMNFCYTNICSHCDVRSGDKTYFPDTPKCINLCQFCFRNMQHTMVTDNIDNKTLASGRAWVTQKAIKNAMLFKGRYIKKWLTENNVRTYRNALTFNAILRSKTDFYLLSDVLEVVNKSSKAVYFCVSMIS